jgi:hypothetical protein
MLFSISLMDLFNLLIFHISSINLEIFQWNILLISFFSYINQRLNSCSRNDIPKKDMFYVVNKSEIKNDFLLVDDV